VERAGESRHLDGGGAVAVKPVEWRTGTAAVRVEVVGAEVTTWLAS
jgi:hypothetical protein